jgi:sulfur relay (sulfurtransferase) DsrF/TusC family protein
MAQKKILIHFSKPPFGTAFYNEGLRAALGISSGIDDNIPTVLFQSDSVYYCLRKTDRTNAKPYFDLFEALGTKFYAVQEDLDERNISGDDLADDIVTIPREQALGLFEENDFNMDF